MNLPFPLKQMGLSPEEQKGCEKILDGAGGLLSRRLNKRISLPISIFLARLQIKPNTVTYFNLILGLLSGFVIARGSYFHLALGGILLQIVSIVDGCDGEIAKLTHQSTPWGAWLDTLADNLSFIAFISGVAISYYRNTQAEWLIWLFYWIVFMLMILFGVMIRYLLKKKNATASLVVYEKEVVSKTFSDQKTMLSHFVQYGKYLVKKDFFSALFCSLALLNQPALILALTALGATVVVFVLSLVNFKQSKVSILPGH